MYSLLVCSSFSVMSPDAPGRIAYVGRIGSNKCPAVTYSKPPLAIGVGIVIQLRPLSSHSSLPSRLYERTLSAPAVTISVRSAFSHTKGVDQLVPSSRGM